MSVPTQKMTSKVINSGLTRDLIVQVTQDQVSNQENLGKALAKINTIIDSSYENVQMLKASIQTHAQFIDYLTSQDEDSEKKFKDFIAAQYKLIEELKRVNEEQQRRDTGHIKELEGQLRVTIEMYEKYNREKNLQDKVGYLFALVVASTTALSIGIAVGLTGGVGAGFSVGAQVAGQLTTPMLLVGRTFYRYINGAFTWCFGSEAGQRDSDSSLRMQDSPSDSVCLDIPVPENTAGQTIASQASVQAITLKNTDVKDSEKKSESEINLGSDSTTQDPISQSEQSDELVLECGDTKRKKEKRTTRATINSAQLQSLAVRANQKFLKQEITLFQKDLKSTIEEVDSLANSAAENAILLNEYIVKQTEHLNALKRKAAANAIDRQTFIEEQNKILAATKAEADRINKLNQEKIDRLKLKLEALGKQQEELTSKRRLKDKVGFGFSMFIATFTASLVGGLVYKATADSLNAFLNAFASANYASTPAIVVGRVFYKGIIGIVKSPVWLYNKCVARCRRDKIQKYKDSEQDNNLDLTVPEITLDVKSNEIPKVEKPDNLGDQKASIEKDHIVTVLSQDPRFVPGDEPVGTILMFSDKGKDSVVKVGDAISSPSLPKESLSSTQSLSNDSIPLSKSATTASDLSHASIGSSSRASSVESQIGVQVVVTLPDATLPVSPIMGTNLSSPHAQPSPRSLSKPLEHADTSNGSVKRTPKLGAQRLKNKHNAKSGVTESSKSRKASTVGARS